MSRRRVEAIVLLLVGCSRAGHSGPAGAGADAASSRARVSSRGAALDDASTAPDALTRPTSPNDASATPAAASVVPRDLRAPDGGPAACRVLRGPVGLDTRAAVALVARGDVVDAVANADGTPQRVAFAAGRVSASPPSDAGLEPPPVAAPRGLAVPCAVAASWAFCPDRAGAVHRRPLDGGEDRIVASSRSGARIAACTLGGSHAALGYLASRRTSEGWVSEAWLTVDDDPAVRISEDGSGATSVTMASHGSSLFALTIDARTALTAMHVRTATRDQGVKLGEDVVVFVGGPGDRRTAGALALPPQGAAWALLPISKDVGDFGLAIVKLDDPPRVDEPVRWAMYPNGLDPAPIAAATGERKTWVARVRPDGAEPSSPRVLEIGALGEDGSWTALTVLPTTGAPTDVAAIVDAAGTLWIGWLDAGGSWVERLACR